MMRKLTEILTDLKRRHCVPGMNDFPEKDVAISKNIDVNLKIVQDLFGNSEDVILRPFAFQQTKTRGALVAIDGLISSERVALDILKPMMYGSIQESPSRPRTMQEVQKAYMIAGEVKEGKTFGDLAEGCLSGDVALFVDGIASILIINTKGYPKRSIEDPQTESVLRGPREGFIENKRTNTALLRRKIKNPNLMAESVIIGKKTNTEITIMYLRNMVSDTLLKEVRTRLSAIHTDDILDSGYIEQCIVDGYSPFFTTIANSEKPDAVAAKILEGRVAIIVDGSPTVLIVPTFFVENFHTTEDYYIAPIFASALRLVRLLAFLISVTVLPFYVALGTYHQELIPTELLITMAVAEGNTPFPAVVEAFIMIIVFEILKEAGVRLPRPAGQAVSMVGAIIIGETAVSAGIIGAPMVISVAMTAVSAFAVPSLANASTLMRLFLLALAGFLGGFGMTLGILCIFFHLSSLSSFGIPYLYPLSPFQPADLRESILRRPPRLFLFRTFGISKCSPRNQRPSQIGGAQK